jgi:eight-cysteine-cluster-containing protein
MPLALILLAVLCFSFYYLVQAEGGWGELPRLLERVGIRLDKFSVFNFQFSNRAGEERDTGDLSADKIPKDYTSGNSRFSRGTCAKDSDCFAGGCSGEVCGNEKDSISTCEYSEDFPSTKRFECGCVNKVCGWRE